MPVPLWARCPVCHEVFGTSIPKSHFREKHLDYVATRRKIYRIGLITMLLPIADLVASGFIWGFASDVGSNSLAATILFLSFLPAIASGVMISRVNKKFRRAWVAAHGKEPRE